MAHKIIWSPVAIDDLEAISAHIARDSEAYAAAAIQRMVVAIELASDFPFMGREVPDMNDRAIRELIVDKYRVIYRVTDGAIAVAAVIHGARSLEIALQDRPGP